MKKPYHDNFYPVIMGDILIKIETFFENNFLHFFFILCIMDSMIFWNALEYECEKVNRKYPNEK